MIRERVGQPEDTPADSRTVSYLKKLCMVDATAWSHHRSGWQAVVRAIREHLHTDNGVAFVSSVDAAVMEGRLIQEPWVGFCHGPVSFSEADRRLIGVDAGLDALVRTAAWQRLAPWCRGLFTLCRHTRRFLESRAPIPVDNLLHPTEQVGRLFTREKFLANPHQKLILIGWWARRIQSIFDLPVTRYQKVWLKSECADYSRLQLIPNPSVHIQSRVSNEDYDRLLEENLVFLDFHDTAANNTVVECIVRHTPLLVRKLPAVVEYLGDNYPLYYSNLEEAAAKVQDVDLLRQTTEYLRGLPIQAQLTLNHFLKSLTDSAIYRRYLPAPVPVQRNAVETAGGWLSQPARPGPKPRLLFASYHCYHDPSSGAALATRDLLELLTARGWASEVFCGPQLDFEENATVPQLLDQHRIPYEVRSCPSGRAPFLLYRFQRGDVPITVYYPAIRHRYDAPLPSPSLPRIEEGMAFLALWERVLERSRPDLLLTYGGHWLAPELIASARRRGCRVIFALHNFMYRSPELFRRVDAVLVPSCFAREHYRQALGLECTAIPGPWNWSQVRCPEILGRFVTFVNPQPHKGVFPFARIASELGCRRPDIPLLVVEGRASAAWLERTGLDLGSPRNLFVKNNTPDPRDFYRVSRMVLMPSLWWESFPRVAAEALINGIPVLGSRRGGLPETLAEAGFLFDVPAQYTPESRLVPTAEEMAPWIETIIRLWDDGEFYERERLRCLTAAEAWRPEPLGARFDEFFTRVGRQAPA